MANPGGQATYYTRDPSGNLISQRTGNTTHYYILDALGSVVALTDASGAVAGRYSYEPYGKAAQTGSATSRFQFASGEADTQTGLIKFGARYYNPTLGRWTQRDPMQGNLADPSTLNSYAYSNCNPINHTDPSGAAVSECAWLYIDFLSAAISWFTGLGTIAALGLGFITGGVGTIVLGVIAIVAGAYGMIRSRIAMDKACTYPS